MPRLQYLRARYYDPEIGRFINQDSLFGNQLNPISLNKYTYAWNNPVNNTDPSGNRPDSGDYSVAHPGISSAGESASPQATHTVSNSSTPQPVSNNPSKAKCSSVNWGLFWNGVVDFSTGVAGLIISATVGIASPLTLLLTIGGVIDSLVSVIDGQTKIIAAIGGPEAIQGTKNYSIIETLFGKKVANVYNAISLLSGISGSLKAIKTAAKAKNIKNIVKLFKQVIGTFNQVINLATK